MPNILVNIPEALGAEIDALVSRCQEQRAKWKTPPKSIKIAAQMAKSDGNTTRANRYLDGLNPFPKRVSRASLATEMLHAGVEAVRQKYTAPNKV